jgi:hypothetical protein
LKIVFQLELLSARASPRLRKPDNLSTLVSSPLLALLANLNIWQEGYGRRWIHYHSSCQIAGVKPRIEEFDAKATRRSPEEFILSRNLRRRHLSVGQKAAIALEWSEQIE